MVSVDAAPIGHSIDHIAIYNSLVISIEACRWRSAITDAKSKNVTVYALHVVAGTKDYVKYSQLFEFIQ